MKFVVPIPLWLYIAFAFVAFSVGVTVMYVVLVLLFIYLLITNPRRVVGFLISIAILAAVFKYWKVTILVLLCAFIFKCIPRKNDMLAEKRLIEVDGVDENKNQG
jgi:hypothetical protein